MVLVQRRKSYLGLGVFLVLFKDGGRRVGARSHPLVYQGIRRLGKFKIFLRDSKDRKILLKASAALI